MKNYKQEDAYIIGEVGNSQLSQSGVFSKVQQRGNRMFEAHAPRACSQKMQKQNGDSADHRTAVHMKEEVQLQPASESRQGP